MTNSTIPTGWKRMKLGDEVKIFGGGTFSSLDAKSSGARWLKIANVGIGKIQWEEESYLPISFLEEYEKYLLKEGDIVLALTRPTLGNKLKIAKIENSDSNSLLNQRVGKLITSENLNKEFVYYILRMDEVTYRINQQLYGTDPPNLSSKAFDFIPLFLPPLPEQNRIVAVLETWDKAIEGLKRKIEVKKHIKKGLMQKLLTGQVRLPGFSGEWKMIKLSDICKRIKTGKLDANAMVDNGRYRFYTCAKNYYKINEYAFDTEALLVSGNGANVGYIHYCKGKFNAYQRTYVLDKFTSNIFFTKYILDKNLKKRIFEEKCDGNTPYIKMDTLTDMKMLFPKEMQEQTAIANILTTADKEIEALEKKLSLLEDQKKFLLNNLITGKIRVPE